MLKAIFTEVRKMNIFRRDMQLEKDYTNKFNSIQSFILSCLVFLATIVVGFLIGEEIYKKERPKVTISTAKIEVEKSEFNFADFPVVIGFADKLGMPLPVADMNKLFSIVIGITSVDENGVKLDFSKLEECNVDKITNKEAKEIVTNRIKTFEYYQQYCLDPSWKLKNKMGTPFSNSIGIQILRCQTNCAENLDEKIDGIFGGITVVNAFIEPSNFSSPIKYYEFSQSFILNNKISEQIVLSFTKNEIITNIGWIFDQYEKNSYISFNEINKSYFFSNIEISRIMLDFPLVVTSLHREYMKIQELIASIGGFFNASYLILSFLFGHYIKFDYYCYVDEKTRYIEFQKKSHILDKSVDFKHINNIKVNNFINIKNDSNNNNIKNQNNRQSEEVSEKNCKHFLKNS